MTFNRRRPRIWTADADPMNRRMTKTSWFQPTNDTIREQETILASTFFLVRQGDEFGERLKCVRCQRRHDYITLMCIEKPISGLANGLYAYYRALKDTHVESELRPEQLTRLKEIYKVLQMMPDLSTTHPEFARKVVKDLGPSDLQISAVSLGILEGISPTEARRLAEKINDQGIKPPFELAPTNRAETDRAMEYRGHQPNSERRKW